MAARAQQKVRIPIPKDLRPKERRAIAKDIIEHIQARTVSGIGIRKRGGVWRRYPFPGYTKDYEKKKGQSNVDLVLKDKMLRNIRLLKERSGFLTIGHKRGKQNDKSEGNQIGSYGQPKGNPRKARRYLGINKTELMEILKAYKEKRGKT